MFRSRFMPCQECGASVDRTRASGARVPARAPGRLPDVRAARRGRAAGDRDPPLPRDGVGPVRVLARRPAGPRGVAAGVATWSYETGAVATSSSGVGARCACTSGTTEAPSPLAAATRFIEPGADVAGGEDAGDRRGQVAGGRPSTQRSFGTSRPVSTKPRSSRASSGGQPVAARLGAEQQEQPLGLRGAALTRRWCPRGPATRAGPSPPPSTTSRCRSAPRCAGCSSISLIRYRDMVSASRRPAHHDRHRAARTGPGGCAAWPAELPPPTTTTS